MAEADSTEVAIRDIERARAEEVREYDETCVCLDEIKAKNSKKCSTAAHNVEEVVFEGGGLEMGKLFAIYNLFLH